MLESIKNRIFRVNAPTKETEGYLRQLDIDKLEPLMVRRDFSEIDIIKLADSICKNGVLFPVPVLFDGNSYKYISGSRRIAASMLLGKKSIICHVYTSIDTSDRLLIASIMHEKKPNPFEIHNLIAYFTKERQFQIQDVAEKLGITISRINELSKLECFSFEERRMINQIDLSEEGIIELSKLCDKDTRNAVIKRLYEESSQNNGKIRRFVRQIRSERSATTANGSKIIDNSFVRLIEQIKSTGKAAVLKKSETDMSTSYTVTVSARDIAYCSSDVSRETSEMA